MEKTNLLLIQFHGSWNKLRTRPGFYRRLQNGRAECTAANFAALARPERLGISLQALQGTKQSAAILQEGFWCVKKPAKLVYRSSLQLGHDTMQLKMKGKRKIAAFTIIYLLLACSACLMTRPIQKRLSTSSLQPTKKAGRSFLKIPACDVNSVHAEYRKMYNCVCSVSSNCGTNSAPVLRFTSQASNRRAFLQKFLAD